MGVILCRLGPQSGRWEAMLVLRRYTYAFSDFVHGRYANRAPLRAAAPLLRDMTVEELLDVFSLNFAQMWYRIWLRTDRREHFQRKAARFRAAFLQGDGGRALRAAALQAPGRGALLWEAPKGRRLSPAEADAACAIREMQEETGIPKKEYQFLPGVRRRVTFVQSRVRYRQVYYVALAGPRLQREADSAEARARPALAEICRTGEVSQARWFSLEQVRLLDGPGRRLEELVRPALRLAKKFSRGALALPPAPSPASRPASPPPAEAPPADGWCRVPSRRRRRASPGPPRRPESARKSSPRPGANAHPRGARALKLPRRGGPAPSLRANPRPGPPF
ncbi:MAG TPA: NUDIX hydrolase [Elusimicrobiota bacterium]|nr:NUDIX hydrolase [Elusimicrobiota bacterium]